MTKDEIVKELKWLHKMTQSKSVVSLCDEAATLIEQQAKTIADNEKTLEDFKADFTKKFEQQAKEIEELKGMNQRQSAGIGRLEEENKELREALANIALGFGWQGMLAFEALGIDVNGMTVEKAKALSRAKADTKEIPK